MTAFRLLPGLPPYGEPAVPFPRSFARSGREGLVVEFLPGTPDPWIGNFKPGVGGYTGVHVHPNGRHVVVFSEASAYVVDPTTRELVGELPGSDFILGVREVSDPPGFVCDLQGLAFYRLGPNGLVWHTRRLSLDGFQDLIFTEARITGSGLEVGGGTWTPFEVDVRSGRTRGGPRIPPQMDYEEHVAET